MTKNEFFLKETQKELAFTIDGVGYYCFTDGGVPIYYNRFREFQQRMQWNEEWKVTNEFLQEHIDMTDKFIKDSSFTAEYKIAQIQRLNENLKFRREQSNNFTLVYDLASIWFFDESEDPAEYNQSYNNKKVEKFTKSRTCILPNGDEVNLLAFFLRTPLNRFIDFQNISEVGTLKYLKKLQELQFSHSLYHFTMLSESEKKESIGQNIAFQMAISQNLTELLDLELQSFTTS